MTEKIMARVDVESIAALLERVASLEAEVARLSAGDEKCSSTVSKTCETQSGLRTERITLEIKHCEPFGVRDWSWVTILRLQSGESVRVVEVPVGSVDDRAYADRMGCDEERDFANRILAERDAAIREREKAVAFWQGELRARTAERDAARARVAELEAASGEREAALARVAHLTDANRALQDAADAACDLLDESKARVAELEAASGGGEQEPDAWGIVRDGNVESVTHRRFRRDAGEVAEQFGGTVVPLYRSPPQPRGWLTEDERELIAGITDEDAYTEDAQNIAKGLLARSSPPEVVLPVADCSWCSDYATVWRECLEAVRSSLAAAGVAVKEVGDED